MTKNRRKFGIFIAPLLGLLAIPTIVSAADDMSLLVKSFDVDHNGVLDVAEVTNAGRAKFGISNTEKDGSLDTKEASKAGIEKRQLAAADPNKDGALDSREFMKVLDARFKAADADKSGTIDAKELSTEAGKALLSMLGAA